MTSAISLMVNLLFYRWIVSLFLVLSIFTSGKTKEMLPVLLSLHCQYFIARAA